VVVTHIMTYLKYFTILGERCSGTHFLQYAIQKNFNLEYYPICGKHFFGHDTTIFETEKMKETLVICLFRNPVDWIDSFFKRLHHVPEENRKSIENFINNEWYSIYEVPPKIGKPIEDDYHIIHKRRYHNIFELRETKNDFMLNMIPKLVDNYMLLRYEDLRDNYEETMINIIQKYKIVPIQIPFYRITQYKGTYTAEFTKKPILLSEEIQEYILSKVNGEQESRISRMDFLGNL